MGSSRIRLGWRIFHVLEVMGGDAVGCWCCFLRFRDNLYTALIVLAGLLLASLLATASRKSSGWELFSRSRMPPLIDSTRLSIYPSDFHSNTHTSGASTIRGSARDPSSTLDNLLNINFATSTINFVATAVLTHPHPHLHPFSILNPHRQLHDSGTLTTHPNFNLTPARRKTHTNFRAVIIPYLGRLHPDLYRHQRREHYS